MAVSALTAIHGDLDTLMAGLACGEVSLLAWDILKDTADAVIAVSDDQAVAMMRQLAAPEAPDRPIVAGESGVAGLAGLMRAVNDPGARSDLKLGLDARVLVIGTESDTDPDLYEDLVGRSGDAVRASA